MFFCHLSLPLIYLLPILLWLFSWRLLPLLQTIYCKKNKNDYNRLDLVNMCMYYIASFILTVFLWTQIEIIEVTVKIKWYLPTTIYNVYPYEKLFLLSSRINQNWNGFFLSNYDIGCSQMIILIVGVFWWTNLRVLKCYRFSQGLH